MNEYLKRLSLFRKYIHWLKPEAIEQAKLVLWLEQKGYTYTSIPNSTWTQSMKQKIVNKITGLNSGLCDIIIILKRESLLFIELKRNEKSLSKVSKKQQDWIERLSQIENVEAKVAYGSEDAIQIIQELEEF